MSTARQLTLDDARVARDDALERVEHNADDGWKDRALDAVYRTATLKREFISDDVWASGLDSTHEDRALGPIFRMAARSGWIVKTDRVRPSARSHASGKPVWCSMIYLE